MWEEQTDENQNKMKQKLNFKSRRTKLFSNQNLELQYTNVSIKINSCGPNINSQFQFLREMVATNSMRTNL